MTIKEDTLNEIEGAEFAHHPLLKQYGTGHGEGGLPPTGEWKAGTRHIAKGIPNTPENHELAADLGKHLHGTGMRLTKEYRGSRTGGRGNQSHVKPEHATHFSLYVHPRGHDYRKKTMNEDNTPTRKIIDAIGLDRPSAIPAAFNEAIGRHISDALTLKKVEVASKIFGPLSESSQDDLRNKAATRNAVAGIMHGYKGPKKKEIEGPCKLCNGKKYDTARGPRHPCKACKGTGKVLYEDSKPSEGTTEKERSEVAKKARKGEDIGHGNFDKVAHKAAEEYGSAEAGKKVAAAAMWKNLHKK